MASRFVPVASTTLVCVLGLFGACQGSEGVGPGAEPEADDSSSSSSAGAVTAASDGGAGSGGDGPCSTDATCPGDAPICIAGRCVACTPERTDACGDGTPVCDDRNTCVPCAAHGQCDLACEIDTGRCIERLIVVDADGGGDVSTIAEALATVGAGESAVVLVHRSDECYNESVAIAPERRIALIGGGGPPGERPCLTSSADDPVISVTGDARAYLDNLRIENAMGVAIDATDSELWIAQSEIVNNQGGGIVVTQTSRLQVRNSIVGGDRNNVPAISARDSDLDIAYSTLAAGFGDSVALQCWGDAFVLVRNSILVSESGSGEVACSGAIIKRSALESAFGVGNVAVGEVDTSAWFSDFTRGDLHLDPEQGTMFESVAKWEVGDPTTDIDGDPRPISHGDADWCGADIPGI